MRLAPARGVKSTAGMTRPRERLLERGPDALDDAELLALVLGTGVPGASAQRLAQELLRRVGGLDGLARSDAARLARLPGIGPGKATRVIAALHLGRRAATRPLARGRAIGSSRDVDAALRPRLARAPVEHFLAIALDAKHRPMAELELARGSLTACPVDTAETFRALLRVEAAAMVFVHNHPSGVPDPSPEDVELTRRLRQGARLLGLDVVDHVIIGAEGYFSFLDAGLLERDDDPPCWNAA